MKILILGMNYAPESTGIAPYTTEFAEYLAAAGHEVHVVTARPHFPQWKIWDDYRGSEFRLTLVNAVHVHRTYVFVPDQPRKILNRILYDTLFSVAVLFRALTIGRCDVVYTVSPPVQLGLTGWIVAKLRGAPLFFHIKDIVSQAVVGTGMAGFSSPVSRIARRVEDAVHNCADSVGVICGAFDRHLRRTGVPAKKIVFFPDYIDTHVLKPTPRLGAFRDKHGIDETEFLVLYSGGIAQKQGLDTLVTAASHAPQLRVFIIGEGPTKADLERDVLEKRLKNVTILPLQPKAMMGQQLSAADVLVLTQKKNVTDAVFPSKLLTYMAFERPIVAAAAEDSETARFIKQHEVGLVVPPEDPEALAAALVELRENPALAAKLAGNARLTVMSTFEKSEVLRRMTTMLTQRQLSPAQ